MRVYEPKKNCFVRNSLLVLGSVAGSTTKNYIAFWLAVTGCRYTEKNEVSVHTGTTYDLSLFVTGTASNS